MNELHAVLFCPCWDCTILQETPVPHKQLHLEVGPCFCSDCLQLRKQQEDLWHKQLQKHIEGVERLQSMTENTVLGSEHIEALTEHYKGNKLINLLLNNITFFRSQLIAANKNNANKRGLP